MNCPEQAGFVAVVSSLIVCQFFNEWMLRLFATGTLTGQMVEQYLTHAHRLGGYFYILILLDVLQSLFEREDNGR